MISEYWLAVISFGVAVSSIGAATFFLVRALQGSDEISRLSVPVQWAIVAMLFFASLSAISVLLQVSREAFPVQVANGTSDLVSLSMGLIGLVITALTGMALSSAWRAKDQAEEAKNAASNALRQFEVNEREFRLSSVFQLARIESLELKLKFTGGKKYRVQSSLANLLATAFSARSDSERFMILKKIGSDEELLGAFRRYALDGSGIYDFLSLLLCNQDLEKEEKRVLHKLLH